MGQGYSVTTPSAGSAGIDVPELGDLVYEKSLGSARFMKTIRARHHDGIALVKVLVKPYTPMTLGSYRDKILRERHILANVPNALGYQRIVETETNGYLVRQFLYNSLYDRLSTRPFLEDIEKKWLAFQLLCALRDCHARSVYHGDIKTENVLVTSWNWLYLTDFSASFKPVLLPDDNPADFSYFFDTSGRRTCYLAPERFVPAAVAAEAAMRNGEDDGESGDSRREGSRMPRSASRGGRRRGSADRDQRRRDSNAASSAAPPNRINGAMDVFGAGCVIAELVLEAPIFSLSQLFRYRRGEYDPAISHLSRIPDRDFAEMIGHMIQLDPEARLSAEEYLERYRGRVFPDYFYSFLHQYMEVITDPSSGQYPASGATRNLGEADERIDRVFYDFDKISYFLGFQDAVISSAAGGGKQQQQQQQQKSLVPSRPPRPPRLGLGLLPVRLSIPTKEHDVCAGAQPTADNGALIFLTLIVASIRNTARAASRIRACDVLLAFAERLTDEARLDRVLPYLMTLLNDRSDMVVVAAVRSITQLLALVRTVSPVNAHVFLEYIMPRMQATILRGSIGGGGAGVRETSPIVRATYAACLGSLATMASHFLEMAAKVDRMTGAGDDADGEGKSGGPAGSKADGGEGGGGDVAGVTLDGLFDAAQRDLFDIFEQHTKALIEDADPYVRRAFLTSVPELCLFFGAADANDIIVTHLNTYLNDRDWMLRCAFFDTIVGVATFLGSVSLEEFILPLMIQSLTDPEEHVVQAVLQALAELAEVGLFSKQTAWELVEVVSRFTVHPNIWIREAAARFLSAATRFLSPAQVRCLFMPLVAPYLKPGLSAMRCSELDLLDHLQRSLSRPVFEQALSWAMKTDRGLFWKPLQKLRGFPFGMSSPPTSASSASSSLGPSGPSGLSGLSGRAARDAIPQSLARVARNEEDEQWISRLRNLGMTAEDEFKLMALREFIWRLGRLKLHDAAAAAAAAAESQSAAAAPNFNNIVPLRSLGITVQTVLFDDEPQRQLRAASLAGSLAATTAAAGGTTTATNFDSNAPRSIEDALQDASMTIDDPISRRRRAALNIHRSRLGRRGGSSSPSPALRDGFLASAGAEAVVPSSSSSPADETTEAARPLPLPLPLPLPSSSSLASSPSSTSSPLLTTAAADETASLSSRRSKAAHLRHRPSAMSLLNRKDSVKSGPETATTEANAFGQVEGRSALVSDIPTRSPAPSDDLDSTVAGATYSDAGTGVGVDAAYRAHHTYTGSDPNVLKMLDAMYHENYPHDVAEFSPMVVPVSRRKMVAAAAAATTTAAATAAAAKAAAGQEIWRPAGQMVATFSEHSGAINRVVVSPDHAFFLTGGDDGTVRVWDTQRLERNISHRSRQVYRHAGGGRVLALCFIENTHCFVSCASDGSVHVIKVEYVAVAGGMPRYNRLRPLREYQLPRDEWAVWCEHFKQEASSVLVLATNRSRVLGIDLRTMTLLFALANPVRHGTPTCFAVDRRRNWLVVATSHGVLDLWDLRFKMRLKGWGVPGGAPIYRLAIHPSKGRGKWLCVAGGTGHGEVTVWDLEKTLCREVYRVGGGGSGGSGGGGGGGGTIYGNGIGNGTSNANRGNLAKGYEPWDVDEDRPESMLGRFATSLDPAAAGNGTAASENGGGGSSSLGLSTLGGGDKGVRAMVVGSAAVDDQRDVRHAFIVTGGSDKRLRFWDLSRVENSLVYSGLLPDEPRPTFSSIQVTTAMTVNTERLPRAMSNGNGDGMLSVRKGSSAPSIASSKAKGRSGGNSNNNNNNSNSNSSSSSRPSRSTVIAMQQQLLLRSHLDAILDAALIESPYTATVSVDRMGVIFVFS